VHASSGRATKPRGAGRSASSTASGSTGRLRTCPNHCRVSTHGVARRLRTVRCCVRYARAAVVVQLCFVGHMVCVQLPWCGPIIHCWRCVSAVTSLLPSLSVPSQQPHCSTPSYTHTHTHG
jgi:hypothetical protein